MVNSKSSVWHARFDQASRTVVVCLFSCLFLAGCKPADVTVKRKADTESSVTQIQATEFNKLRPQVVEYAFEVPLRWADQSELESEILANSDSVISKFKSLKKIDLKCDENGIRWLSKFVDEEREGWPPKLAASLVDSLGSFYAQSVRNSVGGSWYRTENDIELKLNSEKSVYPFKMFREHIELGSANSILAHYESLTSDLDAQTSSSSN